MTMTRMFLALSLAVLGLAATVPVAQAQNNYYYSARQYYGPWVKHGNYSYYYRKYYYKPRYNYYGYKHHYVVYYPSRPKYCYYYNPYKKTYWGRCPSTYGDDYDGQGVYSMLAPEHRKPLLKDIAEASFPKPATPPAIPDSTDNVPLDLPPDDLPEDARPLVTAPLGETAS